MKTETEQIQEKEKLRKIQLKLGMTNYQDMEIKKSQIAVYEDTNNLPKDLKKFRKKTRKMQKKSQFN